MVPPKLTVVPHRDEPEEAREDAARAEPAADASEVLAHEGWRGLPPNERATAVIVTSNYGEAGAIDEYGHRLGLPGDV